MDLADDIAYSVHDFEDAVVGGYVDVAKLQSRVGHDELVSTMLTWVGPEFTRDELLAAFDRLDDLDTWLRSFDGSRADHARLKNLTSKLIGRFANASSRPHARDARGAARALRRHRRGAARGARRDRGAEGHRGELHPRRAAPADLREPARASCRSCATRCCGIGPSALDRAYADDWAAAPDDAARARVVVDQVSTLTDRGAFAWHERHVGD